MKSPILMFIIFSSLILRSNIVLAQEQAVMDWNGDKYYIDSTFTVSSDCAYNNECITIEDNQLLLNFLTNNVLDVWKKEVLKTISENYFNQHIDIVSITGTPMASPDGNHKFILLILYRFESNGIIVPYTYPYPAKNQGIRDDFIIAEKREGVWQKLSENEIENSYRQELEKTHKEKQLKLTEQEIILSTSEKEVLSKLKECHKDMKEYVTYIVSENNSISFFASGSVFNCGPTGNCLPTASITINLMTGESDCINREYESNNNLRKKPLSRNLLLYIGVSAIAIILGLYFLVKSKRWFK